MRPEKRFLTQVTYRLPRVQTSTVTAVYASSPEEAATLAREDFAAEQAGVPILSVTVSRPDLRDPMEYET